MAQHKKKTAKSAARHDYSAPALEKGMDIVELLADVEAGLTISEIAGLLGRGMNELFRIVVVMERRGWLRKDPENSRYYVSYHLLLLAHRGTPAQTLSGAAAPVMQELSVHIDQSCHLVIRTGNQGLVIFRQENPGRHANLSVRMGAVLDLVTSSSGRMLLAHMEREARDAVLRSLPRLATPRASFEEELALIRDRGFTVRRSPMTAGVTDISCPIRAFDGNVLAALTVPYLHVIDEAPNSVDEARPFVEKAARRISHTLGWAG